MLSHRWRAMSIRLTPYGQYVRWHDADVVLGDHFAEGYQNRWYCCVQKYTTHQHLEVVKKYVDKPKVILNYKTPLCDHQWSFQLKTNWWFRRCSKTTSEKYYCLTLRMPASWPPHTPLSFWSCTGSLPDSLKMKFQIVWELKKDGLKFNIYWLIA